MPPSVRALADLPDLGLRALTTDVRALARPVRWVATSELSDPGPYLEGGELVLTTGMRLDPDDAEAARAYVARLVAADVAALAFGPGPVHESTPVVLVEAASEAGLALLEVPAPVPFIAVSKAVSRLLVAEENEQVARGVTAQRELIRAALAAADEGPAEAAAAVLPRLVRHLGGFALLLDAAGGLVHAQPGSAARRLPELLDEVARLRPRGLLAAAVVADAQEHVAVQPLGVHGRTLGFLVVGTREAPGPGDQAVVHLAVSLLSAAFARAHGRAYADDAMRTAAMRMLLAGLLAHLPLGDLGWALPGPVRMVAVEPRSAVDAAAALAAAVPGAAVAARVLAESPGTLVAAVPAGTPADRFATLVDGPEPVASAVGVGDAADPADSAALHRSLVRARRALGVAAGSEEPVRRYEDLGTGLDALWDPGAADAWARDLLAPLRADRTDLAGTLRAWLDRHGQVDAAAGDLGVHRHTVRHRLRRVEALLGRSLDDPEVRAELYLALSRDGTTGTGTA